MKKLLHGFSKGVDFINEWVGRLVCFFVVPLTLVMVYEVFVRFISQPTTISFELSNFIYGAHFMLLGGYGLLKGVHVTIDVISSRFSRRVQTIFMLISYFFMFFPYMIVLVYYGFEYAAEAWSINEMSWSLWGPPLYPIKSVIPMAAMLLLLQGVSEVIKLSWPSPKTVEEVDK